MVHLMRGGPLMRDARWNVRMVVKPDGAGLFRCAWTFDGNYMHDHNAWWPMGWDAYLKEAVDFVDCV